MATKKVPATIAEIAEVIKNYLAELRETASLPNATADLKTVITKLESPYEVFYLEAFYRVKNKGIECTKKEFWQAVKMLQQNGSLPPYNVYFK